MTWVLKWLFEGFVLAQTDAGSLGPVRQRAERSAAPRMARTRVASGRSGVAVRARQPWELRRSVVC